MLIDEGRRYRCNRCGASKPATADHYYFNARGRVTSYCKPCMSDYQRERVAGRNDYLRERDRRQRLAYARRTRGYDPARYRVLP